ncbi:MAG: anthranilate phosphoribosyltransferase [Rhodospirillaceae bacterium]
MSDLKPFLAKVADGAALSESDAEAAFEVIMSGGATHAQMGAFLMALRVRGETVAELTGGARILRAKVLKVDAPPGAIDTCGTGGDGAGTFNISTAVSLVVAACGVPVAKHGNRAVSSKSGTADVLAALGVDLDAAPDLVARALREAGIGFLFAQKHHTAMKHVAPVRAELGQRTLFNLIGPLANPAGAKRQLMGVFARKWIVPLAETLSNLGSERAWVVHGSDGLDEITTTGATFIAELKDGKVSTFELTPEDAGLKRVKPEELKGGDVAHNAAALRTLLHGRGGAYRDIVTLNAGAALVIAGKAADLKEGVAMALDGLMSGRAKKALETLVAITNANEAKRYAMAPVGGTADV